jgi:hypothetical protein
MIFNEVYVQVKTKDDKMTLAISLLEFIESLDSTSEEFANVGGFVSDCVIQEMKTSVLDGVIQILEFCLVDIVVQSANRLEVAGLLYVQDIVLDSEFGADGFVAKNGELDNDGQGVQDEVFVINVFVVVGNLAHMIEKTKKMCVLKRWNNLIAYFKNEDGSNVRIGVAV